MKFIKSDKIAIAVVLIAILSIAVALLANGINKSKRAADNILFDDQQASKHIQVRNENESNNLDELAVSVPQINQEIFSRITTCRRD